MAERAPWHSAAGVMPSKLVEALIELIKNPPAGEDAFLMDLLTHRVPLAWTMLPRSRPASWPPWPTVTSRSA